ncbi:hypothetical protein ACKVWC_011399 [Pyricularia oryzae]
MKQPISRFSTTKDNWLVVMWRMISALWHPRAAAPRCSDLLDNNTAPDQSFHIQWRRDNIDNVLMTAEQAHPLPQWYSLLMPVGIKKN